MEIDKHGRVVNYTITQTVIKTSFRMTYSDVNDILAGDEEKRKEYHKIVSSIELMAKLHETLENMRVKRGALNFDTNEAKILVDKQGKPVDIVLRQRGIAERMIESFMLMANETVAEHFSKLDLPLSIEFTRSLRLKRFRSLLIMLRVLACAFMELPVRLVRRHFKTSCVLLRENLCRCIVHDASSLYAAGSLFGAQSRPLWTSC